MRKKVKSIMVMLLAIVMMMGMLSGCSTGKKSTDNVTTPEATSGAKEVKTVSIHLTGGGDYSDAQSVEDAMNAISVEKYGIKFDLNYVEYGNYAQQSSLMLTGDEADIFMVYITPFSTFVKNGQLLDLTNYYANASKEFKSALAETGVNFDEIVSATTVSGKLYALPRVLTSGASTTLAVAEPFASEFGVEGGNHWTLDDVDAFLAAVHEKYPDKYAIVPQGPGLMSNAYWTWDGLGDDSMVGIIDAFGKDTKVHSLYEDPEFLRLVEHTRMWYEKGYMMQDCLSNSEASATLFTGQGVSCFNVGNDNKYGAGNDIFKTAFLTDDKLVTSNATVICYGINANTKEPEASWKAMELIYTDKEIAKLFANGIEGKHYVLDKDNNAVYPEGKDNTNVGYNAIFESWDYPNTFIGDNVYGDFAEVMKEYVAKTKPSISFGFIFDPEPVVDEYTVCISIMSKYTQPLLLGAVDPDEVIPQAIEELKAAGIDVVIAEKQRQFDEWLSNK